MILSILLIILSIYLVLIIYEMNKPIYKWAFRILRILAFRVARIVKNRFKKKLDNVFNKQ